MDEYGLYYDTNLMTIKSVVDDNDASLKRFRLKCFVGSLSTRDRCLLASLPLLVALMREDELREQHGVRANRQL